MSHRTEERFRRDHPFAIRKQISFGRFLRFAAVTGLVLAGFCIVPSTLPPARAEQPSDAPSQNTYIEQTQGKGYRFERDGWIYVHLEGSPLEIGYQHGYLLAPEIAEAFAVVRLEMTHDTGRDWGFFRRVAHQMLWPKIDSEYQQELRGMVNGLRVQGTNLDLDDLVAFNAFSELPDYYVPWLSEQTNKGHASTHETPEHCSAFVATGSWTKDHDIVMAHNNWTTYMEGTRWRIIFDIVPRSGYRILMDGFPGAIASDDDFGVNSAGMMITETTISNLHGWDPNGKPEFVRAR
jgi:hypothetical protein